MKCQEKEAVYEKTVVVYPKEKLSVFAQNAKKAAEDAGRDQKSERYLELPEEVGGRKVTWQKKTEGRAVPVLGIGVIAAAISLLLTRQEVPNIFRFFDLCPHLQLPFLHFGQIH